MTDAAVATQPEAVGRRRRKRVASRGLAGKVVRRPGALLGLTWVGLVAFVGVFAPLLANSHPLWLETTDGRAWSPAWEHATAADVTLWAVTLVLLASVPLRLGARPRLLLVLGTAVVAGGLSYALVRPPEAVVFAEYRRLAEAGEVRRAVYAPIPYSPSDRQVDRPGMRLSPPDPEAGHWMGTEDNAADVASRMIHASRIALSIGFVATGIAATLGVLIGGVMGYFSGWVDLLGMRLVEVFEAVPQLFLLLTLVAMLEERDESMLYYMMAIIGLTSWPGYARFIRAEFLKLRAMDYVAAARVNGASVVRVLLRHMLPNGVAPVLVAASFGVASAILAESVLSFLGLGLVDQPSWGQMLNQALGVGGGFTWWMSLYPGLAIFLTVFAYNLVGEALRDALDPKLARRQGA